ncbi:ADP-ribosylglycohydrolase family protein [Vreelandella neptunia]|uniref:ADP-ribosylglycohydrolase family protein n=1 Tax=Vreelandella neptunia TaxID=115551 RepID=A0ABZ0YS81_9GAMM|nr:ADP-ribosylglycohydrolase family protein [Halomonas neptunia]MDN3559131.1 ADP-ribosylglycohydrolase family protein [Halomonas neptunia]WQH14092.1 ADP-ribosylglycohydrolase family protein [Halomonas neptunia]
MSEHPLLSSTLVSRYRGCLLAGACGDALGAPVEFWRRSQIIARFGEPGITDYFKAYGRVGAITDDTQMTLFTAEGLLAVEALQAVRNIDVHRQVGAAALQRWLITQGGRSALTEAAPSVESALLAEPTLHARRAPGNTCLSALREMKVLGERAVNDSKGCGGVMRMAPVGLFGACQGLEPRETFSLGKALAWLTHGHPSGYLTGGVMAVLVQRLVEGGSLEEVLTLSLALLADEDGHPETRDALQHAWHLAGTATPYAEAITALGEGWVAEEALAIAVYCALVANDLRHGVVLAVNHDGDSDSTGAIAGNLLGAMHGEVAIPPQWLDQLELREVIAGMGEALCRTAHA